MKQYKRRAEKSPCRLTARHFPYALQARDGCAMGVGDFPALRSMECRALSDELRGVGEQFSVLKEERDAPDGGYRHQCINYPRQERSLSAKDEGYQVKLEDAKQSPVDAADYQQREGYPIQHSYQSFLFGFCAVSGLIMGHHCAIIHSQKSNFWQVNFGVLIRLHAIMIKYETVSSHRNVNKNNEFKCFLPYLRFCWWYCKHKKMKIVHIAEICYFFRKFRNTP